MSLRPGLRSAQTARYSIPRCGTFGQRAFSYSGPAALNQLPQHLHNISNSATFRKHLKAYHCRALWQCFRSQRWNTGGPSISCQNAPDCTKLRLKFQNFPGGDTSVLPSLGTPPPQTPSPLGASRLDLWPSATRSSP